MLCENCLCMCAKRKSIKKIFSQRVQHTQHTYSAHSTAQSIVHSAQSVRTLDSLQLSSFAFLFSFQLCTTSRSFLFRSVSTQRTHSVRNTRTQHSKVRRTEFEANFVLFSFLGVCADSPLHRVRILVVCASLLLLSPCVALRPRAHSSPEKITNTKKSCKRSRKRPRVHV
jgi:hypothetical protein